MSKKNNKNLGNHKPKTKIPAAPAVETQDKKTESTKKENVEPEKPATTDVATVENTETAKLDSLGQALEERGLDPNHRVDLMNLAYQYYHKDDGAAAKKAGLSQNLIENIDHITMISIAAEYASEIAYAKTPFAVSLRKTVLPEMQSALKELGITMSDKVLLLPANNEGTVEVPAAEVKIPAKVKSEIKKTIDARQAKVETDPTKIQNTNDLKATLMHFIANTSPFKGLNDAKNFYRSYLLIQAGDNNDKKCEVDNMSTRQLIAGISEVVGNCPFVTSGFGGYLYRLAKEANSVVPAFASLFLAMKNPRTGNPQLTDNEVAETTAALIDWTAKVRIAAKESNLKILKKDEKKNKAAIEQNEKDLAEIKEVANLSNLPSSDFADNLLDNMKDTDAKKTSIYRQTFETLRKAYYPEAGRGKSYANLAQNIQQHAGIITNLFRGELAQITEYSEANLTDLVEEEAPESDNTTAEKTDTPESETPAENATDKPADDSKKANKKAIDLGSRKK